jgi:hypothetical protein
MTAILAEQRIEARQPHSARTLACRMLSFLDLTENDNLMIPAAGRGALIRPILEGRYVTPNTTFLIESGKGNYRHLCSRLEEVSDAPFLAVHGDFLEMRNVYSPKNRPTKIAMIPPISRFADVSYIMHAWELISPGGRLVAICSDASLRHGSVVCTALRHALDAAGAEMIPVPAQSFADSDVGASLVVMDKPIC